MDAAVLRQFCIYLRRLPGRAHIREPLWPRLQTESSFVPYVLTEGDIRRLLDLSAQLDRPCFLACLYRTLILLLYCTGLRFGEALRLRLRDVDTHAGILFVEPFKGRARWVPFARSLSREMERYLAARKSIASAQPGDRFFVGANSRTLPVSTAACTLRGLFEKAGLKPAQGRVGPRPSAYMGHIDILGTETYLTATPELLELAGSRLRRRYLREDAERSGQR
jgi:integrase